MAFRPSRTTPRGPDPTLNTRIILFCFGAGCALAGIFYDVGWLVTAGIVVLAAGVLLRLINDRRRRNAQEAEWRAERDAADPDATDRRVDPGEAGGRGSSDA